MEIAKFVFAIVATVGAIVGGFVVYKGLDLRKPESWLYGAAAFLCGLVAGLLFGNVIEGLKGGAIVAFIILFSSAMTRWHKQRYEGMASTLLPKYGKEDDSSLFAKLVRKLLGKYK